jgi:hypothetical protein
VPEDGLLVQGGPVQGGPADAPTAFAALVYEVPDGETPGDLVLSVAPEATVTEASLRLCPLADASFTPAQGGPASEAPAYDCSTPIPGTRAADGTSYAFAVAGMERDGRLAVAVLPTSPADRVVFERPTEESLQRTTTKFPAAGGFGSASDAFAAPPATQEPFAALPLPPTAGVLLSPPAADAAALRDPGPVGTQTAASDFADLTGPGLSAEVQPITAVGLVVALALGAVVWFFLGREVPGRTGSGTA